MQLRMIVVYLQFDLQGQKKRHLKLFPSLGHCLPGGRLKALSGAVGDSSPGQTGIPLSHSHTWCAS